MTRKVVLNTWSIAVFRHIFLLLFFCDSREENWRIPVVSRIKLKFREHVHQNAPLICFTLVDVVYCINIITCFVPKISRPFPVACTQIVECVLLLNLKFSLYRVGFDMICKGCRQGEFVLILSYFGCWI